MPPTWSGVRANTGQSHQCGDAPKLHAALIVKPASVPHPSSNRAACGSACSACNAAPWPDNKHAGYWELSGRRLQPTRLVWGVSMIAATPPAVVAAAVEFFSP